MLSTVSANTSETEIGISVVTLIEVARADTPERKAKRRQFIQKLQIALPIYLVTAMVAVWAGEIDGENQARGLRLPLSDLLIVVTALELSYSVAATNLRHVQMIPGLTIVQF